MFAVIAELVLLIVCLAVLHWSRRLPHYGFEWVLCGLLAFLPAVILGAIEYAGHPQLHPWHQLASDVGAAAGMPLLLIGLVAPVQNAPSARWLLWSLALVLPLGVLLEKVRLPGQIVLVITVLVLGVSCRRRPAVLPAWLVGVAALAGAMTLLSFRSAHGDAFEAMFHILLGVFLLAVAWLSCALAADPGTARVSVQSSA